VETIATVYTDGFLMVFGDVLRIIFVLVMMFSTNVHLSYITLAILPLMVVITRFFQKRLKKHSEMKETGLPTKILLFRKDWRECRSFRFSTGRKLNLKV
jgi:ABC-type bacteriocin/lantibiotic exporter with double-glycine peptidase domain